MRIFVTGAAGSVGACLVPGLVADGHSVMAMDRSDSVKLLFRNVEAFIADLENLTDESLKAIAGADCIVHLAGVTGMFDPRSFEVNYQGTMNIVKAILPDKEVKFLFVSSTDAYGPTGENMVHDDCDDEKPVFIYGESKKKAEMALRQHSEHHPHFRYCSIRIGNVVSNSDDNLLAELKRNASSIVLRYLFGHYELNLVGVDLVAIGIRQIINRNMFDNRTRFMPGTPVSMNMISGKNNQDMIGRAMGHFVASIMMLTGRGGVLCYMTGGGARRPYRRYTMKIYDDLGVEKPSLPRMKG